MNYVRVVLLSQVNWVVTLDNHQLEQIERLIEGGKFKEALKEIELIESTELTQDEQLTLKYFLSTLYLEIGKYEEGKKATEELMEESRKCGNQLRELDAILNTIWGKSEHFFAWDISWSEMMSEGWKTKLVGRAEELIQNLSQDQQAEVKVRKAAFFYYKGKLLGNKESDQALNFLETSLSLRKEIRNPKDIAQTLAAIGGIYCGKGEKKRALKYHQESLSRMEAIGHQKGIAMSFMSLGNFYLRNGELDQALKYFQQSLAKLESIGHQLFSSVCILYISTIYSHKGELNQALEYQRRALTINEELGYQIPIGVSLARIAGLYYQKGDINLALDFFERALKIHREQEADYWIADVLYQLIFYHANGLSPETITSYLDEFRAIKDRLESWPVINQQYRLANAIALKTKGRLADKMTAQTIFRQITEEDMVGFGLTIAALFNLAELLIFELQTTGDERVLNEVKQLTERLLTIAQDQHSYSLIAETYLLQSKLAMLDLDVKRAQDLVQQAERIAEENGLQKLADVISIERVSLLSQIDKWEMIFSQKPSMRERIELTQLDTLLEGIVHQRLFQKKKEVIQYTERARQLVEKWERS